MVKQSLEKIIKNGELPFAPDQFITVEEISIIHNYNYNSEINRLMKIKDIPASKVDGSTITWKMFFKARNQRIEALLNTIDCLIQKEKLLGYHNQKISVSLLNQCSVVAEAPKEDLDFTKLNFEQQVDFMQLILKAKWQPYTPIGISQTSNLSIDILQNDEQSEVEVTNVTLIEIENLPAPKVINNGFVNNDHTLKLRESLAKMAANSFKDAGGNLSEDEKVLLN